MSNLTRFLGGSHVFIRFDSALAEQALSRIDAFIEEV